MNTKLKHCLYTWTLFLMLSIQFQVNKVKGYITINLLKSVLTKINSSKKVLHWFRTLFLLQSNFGAVFRVSFFFFRDVAWYGVLHRHKSFRLCLDLSVLLADDIFTRVIRVWF